MFKISDGYCFSSYSSLYLSIFTSIYICLVSLTLRILIYTLFGYAGQWDGVFVGAPIWVEVWGGVPEGLFETPKLRATSIDFVISGLKSVRNGSYGLMMIRMGMVRS